VAIVPNQYFSPERHYSLPRLQKKIIDLYDQSTLEDRAKMSYFYLDSLSLIDLNLWDPNSELGDLQLMVLASWMNHEEARAAKMMKVMEREET